MAVYVDDMFRHPVGRLGKMTMSHMIADTEAELHAMADRIGVAREWHQGDHYDIARTKRKLSVQAGAREITMRQLSAMAALRRSGQPMGVPETAIERLQAWFRRNNESSVAPETSAASAVP